jgi:GntR family transcriptional regulator, rspAB operon transcriptional repressor
MDATLRPRDAIAPQLFSKLRQAIIEMTLRPGEALSENEIASRFGVSRQPVREAFIKLSEAGLLQILPNRGTFVVKISVREVANARFVREAVEVGIARSASRMMTTAQIDGLFEGLEHQRAAVAGADHRRLNLLDDAFHRAIADVVDCDYAARIVEGARAQTDRVRYLGLWHAASMTIIVEQHAAIVEALARRDPDAAEAAMRRHLREIMITLPLIAARFPDLFGDCEVPAHAEMLQSY